MARPHLPPTPARRREAVSGRVSVPARRAFPVAATWLLTALLAGCGGGGGGSAAFAPSPSPGPTPEPPVGLAGLVVDGPVSGAGVVILDAGGNEIASGTTDASGAYDIDVPADAAYPLTLRATGGTDIITGEDSDLVLSTVVPEGSPLPIATPLSTLLVRRAECSAELGDTDPIAARAALQDEDVEALADFSFGLDPTMLAGLLGGQPADAGEAVSLLLASEALAETLRRTSVALAGSTDAGTPDELLDALACDLDDYALDGDETGASGRIAAAFNVASAAVLAEVVQGRLMIAGTDVVAALENAANTAFGQSGASVAGLPLGDSLVGQFQRAAQAAARAAPGTELLDLFETASNVTAGQTRAQVATLGIDTTTVATAVDGALGDVATAESGSLAAVNDAARPPAVDAPPAVRPTVTLTADPQIISAGEDQVTTLSWTSTDATSCFLSSDPATPAWSGEAATSGTIADVALDNTSAVFEIRCAGAGGVSTDPPLAVIVEPTQPLAGLVLDGPTGAASVVALGPDGAQLNATLSSANGTFELELPESEAFYPVTLLATGGTNTVTAAANPFTLATVVPSPRTGAGTEAVLSPMSTWLVRRQECTARLTGGDADDERAARNDLAAPANRTAAAAALTPWAFGLSDLLVNSMFTAGFAGDAERAQMLLAAETMAETLRRTSTALAGDPDAVGVDALLTALACDLTDDDLDGAETGVTRRQTAAFLLSAAVVLHEAVRGELQVGGTAADAALEAAFLATFGTPTTIDDAALSASVLGQLQRTVLAATVTAPGDALLDLFDQSLALSAGNTRGALRTLLDLVAPITTELTDVLAGVGALSNDQLDDLLAAAGFVDPVPVPMINKLLAEQPGTDILSDVLPTRTSDFIEVDWDSVNTLVCLRSGAASTGWPGAGAASGVFTPAGAITGIRDFELRCAGPGGVVAATERVVVPPGATFAAVPNAVDPGDPATIVTIGLLDAAACDLYIDGVLDQADVTTTSIELPGYTPTFDPVFRVECDGVDGAASAIVSATPLRVRLARLDWLSPTLTVDGSDIIGAGRCIEDYVVSFGTSPTDLDQSVTVRPPGEIDGICSGGGDVPATTIDQSLAFSDVGLTPGTTVYFAVTAIDNEGNESGFSEIVSKTIP